jgi:phage shock protein PspC (stress-responsive transcriptional regulator)
VQVLRSLCLAPRPGARLLPALRPLPPAELTPAVAGIAGLLAVTVVADVWASRTHRPTISAFVAEVSRHPVGGPIVAGVIAGLVHHLAIDPVIRRLERYPAV